jgi:asparagine synthase (glutamine-hydrolysing)
MAKYLEVNREFIYQKLTPYWTDPSKLINMKEYKNIGNDNINYPELLWSEEMMLIDQQYYLQDNILTKLDRTSMAVSLEARVPFLTHKMVELSWDFPTSLKFKNKGDKGKLILRKLLERYIPQEMIDRPKQGFGLPLNIWLRGPLRDWVENIFNKNIVEKSGLNRLEVEKLWKNHLNGYNLQEKIWSIVMYIQWHERVFGD